MRRCRLPQGIYEKFPFEGPQTDTYRCVEIHYFYILTFFFFNLNLIFIFADHDVFMFLSCRRKTLPVLLAGLYLEIRQIRRIDQTLPKTHGPKTIHLLAVSKSLQQIGSSVATHEKTLAAFVCKNFLRVIVAIQVVNAFVYQNK